MNPYDALGVQPDADAQEIKRAYREKAGKTHPDKEGGDTEAFQQVQKAYALLSNPEKRARYDETGSTDDAPDLETRAHQTLAKMFAAIVDRIDSPERVDIVAQLEQAVHNSIKKVQADIDDAKDERKKWEQVKKRLRKKSAKSPVLLNVATQRLASIDQAMAAFEDGLRLGATMLAMLPEYEYEVDAPQQSLLEEWATATQYMNHPFAFFK